MSEHTRKQVEEVEKIDLIRIINHMWKGFCRYWTDIQYLFELQVWSLL